MLLLIFLQRTALSISWIDDGVNVRIRFFISE
jgi:hypothetical protein